MDSLSAEERLEELFEAHHGRLFRLALRICRDREDARDLVQETFVRAARHVGSLPAGERAEGWLVRTLVNLCRDRGRRRAVRERDVAYQLTRTYSNPEAVAHARLTVRAALQGLSPVRRTVIALVEIEGLTSREAGSLLGMQSATVRWHLSRARKQLARWIETRGEGTGKEAG